MSNWTYSYKALDEVRRANRLNFNDPTEFEDHVVRQVLEASGATKEINRLRALLEAERVVIENLRQENADLYKLSRVA